MKNAAFFLSKWLLVLSLTLYGSVSMAATGGVDGAFSMEICANGVSKTVVFDSDGTPTDPKQPNHDCLLCCDTSNILPITSVGFDQLVSHPYTLVSAPPFQNAFINTRNTRPMPRGPPVQHIAVLTTPGVFLTNQTPNGHKTRSDGRPLCKDANA